MDCPGVAEDDVAVGYLRDTLSAAERSAFEEHFFDCTPCFELLQVLQTLQQILR